MCVSGHIFGFHVFRCSLFLVLKPIEHDLKSGPGAAPGRPGGAPGGPGLVLEVLEVVLWGSTALGPPPKYRVGPPGAGPGPRGAPPGRPGAAPGPLLETF